MNTNDPLREVGELTNVRAEVAWNLGLDAIKRRCYETGEPVRLFSNREGR
jgi:3-polyprenyl-4-hydroxybenzoate decarboxylase